MDRDKAKVQLKEAIGECFDSGEIADGRDGYIGDNIISLMAEAALSVLVATEDCCEYLRNEQLL